MTVGRFDESKNGSGTAIDFHQPAIRAGRLRHLLGSDPQIAVAKRDRGDHSEVRPFAQILAGHIEALQSSVPPVGDVDDAPVVNGDPVRLVELSWAASGRTPLAQPFALGRIFQYARISVAVCDEEMAVRSKGDIGCTSESGFAGGLLAD